MTSLTYTGGVVAGPVVWAGAVLEGRALPPAAACHAVSCTQVETYDEVYRLLRLYWRYWLSILYRLYWLQFSVYSPLTPVSLLTETNWPVLPCQVVSAWLAWG